MSAQVSTRQLMASDLNRYFVPGKRKGVLRIIRVLAYTPGLWIMFFYRVGHRLAKLSSAHRVFKLISAPYSLLYFLLELLTGIYIVLDAEIGPGLYIGHYGNIFVAGVIGSNCNISHEVTIGFGGRGEKWGLPTIGDRVYIAPGAKVFGKITIGNDVAIGANAVVNKDVPDNAVVGGVPAKILSMKGSADFVVIGNDEAEQ